MPLVGLLLSLSLSATVDVDAVLITRKAGLTATQAAELQDRVVKALDENGVKVKLSGAALNAALKRLDVKDTSACNGRRSCVQELARQLNATALVGLSVTRVDKETALALELIPTGDAPSTVKDGFIAPPGKEPLAPLVQGFATRIREHLAPEPAPTPPVAATPNLVPPPQPPPLVDVTPPAPERSRTTPVVLATLGGVSLAAGIALVIVGAVTRGTLNATEPVGSFRGSTLDEATAFQRNTEANVATGAGIGAAAVGAGLLTGAIITW